MKKLIMLALLVSDVSANEIKCLSEIMYSEAQGEPVTGLIAVAEASANRSKVQKRAVCKITGVTRKTVPKALQSHYQSIAENVVRLQTNDQAKNADSWEARLPRNKGKITAKIGRHYFYKVRKNADGNNK